MCNCKCKCTYRPECKLCGCGGKYFTPNCSCICHKPYQQYPIYPWYPTYQEPVWCGTGTGTVTVSNNTGGSQ